MKLIMVGPAGSGKGTQSHFISEQYNIPEISTGSLLRGRAKVRDELGEKIDNIISMGNMVSDDIIIKILFDRLKEDDCKNGFILDGFPRNIEQAIELEKFLENEKNNIDAVLIFNVPRDIVFKRITGRFQCGNCGKIYNKFFNNTKREGVCDVCGSNEFNVRSDDENLDAINKRLDIYENMSKEIIDFYSKKSLTFSLNALKTVEEVRQEIVKILVNINK